MIWIHFISFSSLIAIAMTSKILLNNSRESGQPCLVPDLRVNAFIFLTVENDVYCEFVMYALCYGELSPLHTLSGEFLIKILCLILSKAFFAYIETIIFFCLFDLLKCCITLIDLYMLKKT